VIEILSSVDFNKVKFDVMFIENNYGKEWAESREVDIDELLLDNGYVFVEDLMWDKIYKHKNLQ
jgi:hypothetical protein